MANDAPTAPQQQSAAEAPATPEKVEQRGPAFHSVRDTSHNAFEVEKYHRARNHIAGLGDRSASDIFKDYRRSRLTPFFGSNEPEPIFEEEKTLHPCQIFARDVHACLEANNNAFSLCQSRVATFQHCLKEFSM